MLFSEPKIPQLLLPYLTQLVAAGFSALQRAENSSIRTAYRIIARLSRVSVLFSEPKIPQFSSTNTAVAATCVSVLFSEPKIPQFTMRRKPLPRYEIVSVLFSEPKIPQSFLETEMLLAVLEFQCSSASRKFLNRHQPVAGVDDQRVSVLFSEPKIPQFRSDEPAVIGVDCFSALQRAENSSINISLYVGAKYPVSVLFSEPKIPQLGVTTTGLATGVCFSALQRAENSSMRGRRVRKKKSARFSALQRAENSSIRPSGRASQLTSKFQCSSASRKFLNYEFSTFDDGDERVSVLFSEPKIPQSRPFVIQRPSS